MSVEAFTGEIRMFAGTFPPRDWAFCDGQILAIKNHQALFSLLGTMYGGDGRSTMALPDLRGRIPLHAGGSEGPGLHRYRQGELGGREWQELTADQMPSHTHSYGGTETTANLAIYNDVGDQDKVDATTQSMAISGVGGESQFQIKMDFQKMHLMQLFLMPLKYRQFNLQQILRVWGMLFLTCNLI